jgi:hypothetical protein
MNQPEPYNISIEPIRHLKHKVHKVVQEIKETRALVETNPTLKGLLKPDALILPPLYSEVLKLQHIFKVNLPGTPEPRKHDTPLEVYGNVDAIEKRWDETYGVEVDCGLVRMKTLLEYTFASVQGFEVATRPDHQQDQMEDTDEHENDD